VGHVAGCSRLSLAYGVLYGSSTDSRWHECGHGTAFETRWMNEVIYQIACFMVLREPTVRRWSHARRHTDTIIVGRDPEVVASTTHFARHFPYVLRHQASAVLYLEGRLSLGRQAHRR
jgi:fatty acid desaturase